VCVALSFFRFLSQLDFLPSQIKLETALGKFNLEIAVLQEEKSALQHALNEVREESVRKQTMYTSVSASVEKALAQTDEASKRLVQAEERRAVSAEREALEAVKMVNELSRGC
jgi:predicted  nucleic acid-binding Zn-ribbon protein